MPAAAAPLSRRDAELQVLPGCLLVTFLIRMDAVLSALAVPPTEFLQGLRAASAAISFAECCREEERPDELLPWAGNV